MKLPMDMRIPLLELKILLESNPLKSRILVRRLAVRVNRQNGNHVGGNRVGGFQTESGPTGLKSDVDAAVLASQSTVIHKNM